MLNTRNDDIIGKYFDLVQNEIKQLIANDQDIKQSQVQEFNDAIFNQDDEIKTQMKQYIDKATMNNLDIKRVAKVIYDKFSKQIKNNLFTKDTVNDIPNPMLGERKHLKTFEQFNDNEL